MENIVQKIETLTSELNKNLPMEQARKTALDKKFRLEFNYNSNHLEGNTLTYSETDLLLIFDKTQGNHTHREYEEMKAHDVAWQLINNWAADGEQPLTELDIKNLNEIILVKPFYKDARTPDGQPARRLIKIGDYKTFPNSVQLSNGEIFEYASVADTPIKMGELMAWYKDEVQKNELHPVALAALVHYKFVCIHPFDDGNGRVSRLLMNYILLKNNLPPVIIKSADKPNYLFALNAADTGNINVFIKYIAQQLIWSLELSIKAAKGESIEEADDIYKEIEIWKKQAILGHKIIKRDSRLVYEIYINSIKRMIREFHKHEIFYELFEKLKLVIDRNGEMVTDSKWLDAEMSQIIPDNSPLFIIIEVILENYKYNGTDIFTITNRLKFDFEQYRYIISYGDSQIEKKYGEFLDIAEQDKIIAEYVGWAFAEIKRKTVE